MDQRVDLTMEHDPGTETMEEDPMVIDLSSDPPEDSDNKSQSSSSIAPLFAPLPPLPRNIHLIRNEADRDEATALLLSFVLHPIWQSIIQLGGCPKVVCLEFR
jgi:hypothetical protein